MFSQFIEIFSRWACLTIACGLLSLMALASPASAQSAVTRDAAGLEALIKAAKAEGELTFYCAQVEIVARRVAEAFTAKYGIKAQYIRLASAQLQQRYNAEAESGNFAADVIFNAGNAEGFAADGIKKGWVESISTAGLPALAPGSGFPTPLLRGATAVIQVAPEYIVYNTDKVKGADIPKNWPDLLSPKFRGQIIVADPRASDATLSQWIQVLNKYGEPYLRAFNLQIGRRHGGGVPAIQSLAAGEGMLMIPITRPSIEALQAKGAPVAGFIPEVVTGVEIQVMLTARAKSRHPNAGRLMANYVLSPEGNAVFNADKGSFPVYDLSSLPKGYEAPPPVTAEIKEQITKLLGF